MPAVRGYPLPWYSEVASCYTAYKQVIHAQAMEGLVLNYHAQLDIP